MGRLEAVKFIAGTNGNGTEPKCSPTGARRGFGIVIGVRVQFMWCWS